MVQRTLPGLNFRFWGHDPLYHWHIDRRFSYFGINFAHRGSVSFIRDRGPRLVVEAPVAWLVWPGPRMQYGDPGKSRFWDHRFASFDGPRVLSWRRNLLFPSTKGSWIFPHVPGERMRLTFDELLAYLERGESFHDEAVHALEGMLLLLRSKEVPGNSQVSDHRLEAAVAEIRKNPSHKWDFDLISQKIGLSAAHFRRRFRSVYGHPPSRFVFRLRMERSAELIRGSGARFMEIADAMGFEDINYWHKCFRRHFGISAGAYRREFMAG